MEINFKTKFIQIYGTHRGSNVGYYSCFMIVLFFLNS
jgi:hypothetical protein